MMNHDPTRYSKDARVIACKAEQCTETRENGDLGELMRDGWGVDAGRWLCPAHLAERDAPAVAKAEAEIERQAEKKKRAAAEQEKLLDEGNR